MSDSKMSRFSIVPMKWASRMFAGAVHGRNVLYEKNWLHTHRLSTPVVSVGNLTVGGTGKTPIVLWLAKNLVEKGKRVVVLTRGYGGKFSGEKRVNLRSSEYFGDEPEMIAHRLDSDKAAVYAGPDRVASGQLAEQEFLPDLFLLDDGFQHRRLAREVDIVLCDSTQDAKDYNLLPLGLSREPIKSLNRAQWVIMTKVNLVPEDVCIKQSRDLTEMFSHLRDRILYSSYRVHSLVTKDEEILAERITEVFKDEPTLLVSGIAKPDAFETTVRSLGAFAVRKHLAHPDHYFYNSQDLKRIQEEAQKLSIQLVITTEKDFVKLRKLVSGNNLRFAYLRIEADVRGGESLVNEVLRLCD